MNVTVVINASPLFFKDGDSASTRIGNWNHCCHHCHQPSLYKRGRSIEVVGGIQQRSRVTKVVGAVGDASEIQLENRSFKPVTDPQNRSVTGRHQHQRMVPQ